MEMRHQRRWIRRKKAEKWQKGDFKKAWHSCTPERGEGNRIEGSAWSLSTALAAHPLGNSSCRDRRRAGLLLHKYTVELLQQSWRGWKENVLGARTQKLSWSEAAVEMRCHPCHRRATAPSVIARKNKVGILGYWNEIDEVVCHPDDKPLCFLFFFFLLKLHFVMSGPHAGIFLLSFLSWCCLALLKMCISISQMQIIVLDRLCNLIIKIQHLFLSVWNLEQKFPTCQHNGKHWWSHLILRIAIIRHTCIYKFRLDRKEEFCSGKKKKKSWCPAICCYWNGCWISH